MKIASFLYSVACSASEITTAFPYFGTTQMDLSILWGTDQPIALKSAVNCQFSEKYYIFANYKATVRISQSKDFMS